MIVCIAFLLRHHTLRFVERGSCVYRIFYPKPLKSLVWYVERWKLPLYRSRSARHLPVHGLYPIFYHSSRFIYVRIIGSTSSTSTQHREIKGLGVELVWNERDGLFHMRYTPSSLTPGSRLTPMARAAEVFPETGLPGAHDPRSSRGLRQILKDNKVLSAFRTLCYTITHNQTVM